MLQHYEFKICSNYCDVTWSKANMAGLLSGMEGNHQNLKIYSPCIKYLYGPSLSNNYL